MQNLAEYLASEQAREEVARMVAAPPGIIKAHRIDGGFLARGWKDAGVWSQIGVIRGDFERSVIVSAYYRFDGARYVVTDLGDGWRQHRLRTGRVDWTAEIIAACDYNPYIVDTGERATAGDCENLILKASDLPDAICRVMLASLRVMEAAL